MKRFLLSVLAVMLVALAGAQSSKGHLFIIGGGARPDSLMSRFLALGGGNYGKVLVVPFASAEPVQTGESQAEGLRKIGCKSVDYILCDSTQIDSPEMLAKLDGVTAVFFSGGDQNRLTKMLLGTKFLEKIRAIYQGGGVVGGTSAGAAVMSKMMITGNETLNANKERDFWFIKQGNVKTAEGFGFVENVIVDQHFIVRKRENRLINLVIENPKLIGVGVDEATAAIIRPDGLLEVAGCSGVMIFENKSRDKKLRTDKEGHLAAENINLKILLAGDTYRLFYNEKRR